MPCNFCRMWPHLICMRTLQFSHWVQTFQKTCQLIISWTESVKWTHFEHVRHRLGPQSISRTCLVIFNKRRGGETARLLHSAYTQHPRWEDAACDNIIDRLMKIKRKCMQKLLLVWELSCLDISLMNIPQPQPLPGETETMPYVLVADDAFLFVTRCYETVWRTPLNVGGVHLQLQVVTCTKGSGECLWHHG